MFDRDENLKDTQKDIPKDNSLVPISYGLKSFHSDSYTKASKLITALYMVTDVLDKEEPMKKKLRSLGTEIISDIHTDPSKAINKISETISFLSIARAMNLISEMNCNILKKEFASLDNIIKEHSSVKPSWLEDFLISPSTSKENENFQVMSDTSIRHKIFQEQRLQTRIGVQKGSTLMKALSDKTSLLTKLTKNNPAPYEAAGFRSGFDLLKKQRRDDIIRILKINNGGLTITDIKTRAKELPKPADSLIICSEKTLQRELVSMVKDNLLNRTGSKRWSRYFVAK